MTKKQNYFAFRNNQNNTNFVFMTIVSFRRYRFITIVLDVIIDMIISINVHIYIFR